MENRKPHLYRDSLYGSIPYKGDNHDRTRAPRFAPEPCSVPVSAFVWQDAVLQEAEKRDDGRAYCFSPARSPLVPALDKRFKPNARLKKAMADAAKLIG